MPPSRLLPLIRQFLLPLIVLAALPAPAVAAKPVAWLWDEAELPPWSAGEAAILRRHILLSGDRIQTRPRMRQPAMPAATRVTPVLHVEVSTVDPPRRIEASRATILHAMREAAAASTSGWVQLDMEAKPSQRLFYRSLVREARAGLPPGVKLSVTALAWWCRSPAWLDGLAADEVVPMFFRMGKDSAPMRAIVEQSPARLHPACRAGSAGFSPQEPFAPRVGARYAKTYWFDRHAWKRGTPDPTLPEPPPPLKRTMP